MAGSERPRCPACDTVLFGEDCARCGWEGGGFFYPRDPEAVEEDSALLPAAQIMACWNCGGVIPAHSECCMYCGWWLHCEPKDWDGWNPKPVSEEIERIFPPRRRRGTTKESLKFNLPGTGRPRQRTGRPRQRYVSGYRVPAACNG